MQESNQNQVKKVIEEMKQLDDDIEYLFNLGGTFVMVRNASPKEINEWLEQEVRP